MSDFPTAWKKNHTFVTPSPNPGANGRHYLQINGVGRSSPISVVPQDNRPSGRRFLILFFAILTVVVIGVVIGTVVVLSEDEEASSVAPTVSPSLEPTTAPTLSPTRACEFDICGCDQAPSELIDIVFIADESGSVGFDNYNLMKEAIGSFVLQLNPPVDPTFGPRIAYVEFSTNANDLIRLSDTSSGEEFVNTLAELVFDNGFTNHAAALDLVDNMLDQPGQELRDDSQLLIIMLTDGDPCLFGCSNDCCPFSFEVGNGDEVLRRIRGKRDYTFYFLPLIPPPNFDPVSLDLFDGALVGDNALSVEDELVRFDPVAFSDLEEFLLSDRFGFPLGVCVDLPVIP